MAASLRQAIKLVESWHPRGCKTEKDLERSLARHLEKNLDKSEIIRQYAAGRVKGDIVVDGKILIEIKHNLDSTGKVQRLLGQVDIYASKWDGKVIIVISGKSQRDLLKMVEKKVDALLVPIPGFLGLVVEPKIYLRVK